MTTKTRAASPWLTGRHRKGWRSAFEALLDHWRPEGPQDGWQLDEDGITMVSISADEWLIARGRQHLSREIADPAGSLARAGQASDVDARTSAASPTSALPPEVLAQAIEQFIRRHCAQWCDETIPAPGGLTPCQAITTSAGLERVKGLLHETKDGEQRQSAAQGRPAVS